MEEFKQGISHSIADGTKVHFWEDAWISKIPLFTLFPAIYSVSNSKNLKIAEVMSMDNGNLDWSLNFSRRLYDHEVAEVTDLLTLLHNFQLGDTPEDRRIWCWSKNETFSVKSAYMHLHATEKGMFGQCLWKRQVIPAAIVWSIWLERNQRTFGEVENEMGRLANSIKVMAFRWVSQEEEFKRVTVDVILGNWKSFIFDPP
ncbi:hypothetical protein BVC80_1395g21 [Macleaya cordata]|uniref:Reverse transcriptase zinc-binding domain n=1 Tax=Macleaya cordata TaxID=56857 RepID=A0A200Q1H5_MACCD|nr:hypothetical protein BVC80_1395g21 [Macleaya cordata]